MITELIVPDGEPFETAGPVPTDRPLYGLKAFSTTIGSLLLLGNTLLDKPRRGRNKFDTVGLAKIDQRRSRIVELRLFSGLSSARAEVGLRKNWREKPVPAETQSFWSSSSFLCISS
jgi:hypothetical protein